MAWLIHYLLCAVGVHAFDYKMREDYTKIRRCGVCKKSQHWFIPDQGGEMWWAKYDGPFDAKGGQ